jgi:hypothetical protein
VHLGHVANFKIHLQTSSSLCDIFQMDESEGARFVAPGSIIVVSDANHGRKD